MDKLGILDIPYLVNARGGSMYDSMLVGVLLGEVNTPEEFTGINLKNPNDRFAVVDLVGIVTQTNKYYAKGRVFTVVDKALLEAAKVKKSGRLAVYLNKGSIRAGRRKGSENFISMMNWSKSNNMWEVSKVEAYGFRKNDLPEFFTMIAKAYNNDWVFDFPVTIPSSYTEACEGVEFSFVDPEVDKAVNSGVNKAPSNYLDVKQTANQPNPQIQSVASSSLFGSSSQSLGSSTSSNIQDLVQNRASTHNDVKDISKFVVENRDHLAPKSKNIRIFESAIDNADAKVSQLLKNLRKQLTPNKESKDTESEDIEKENPFNYTEYIDFTATQLKNTWGNKVGAYTGRQLFKEAVERVIPEFASKDNNDTSPFMSNLNILGTELVDEWAHFSGKFTNNKVVDELFANQDKIYLSIIELLLGLTGDLVRALPSVVKEGINIIRLLQVNPYSLSFIDPRISVESLDKLAMLYGIKLDTPEIIFTRNVAYMHNYMLDSNNRIIGENTVVKYQQLVNNVFAGYILPKRSYDTLTLEGTVVQKNKIISLNYFISKDVTLENFQLPLAGWAPRGSKYILRLQQDAKDVVDDFIKSGLGVFVEINNVQYVSDFLFAKKEIYIYNRLRELASVGVREIADEDIKKCVSDFEILKAKQLGLQPGEFKLEQRQAEAVSLIRNPVMCLTGPAGSGKTTTAEALVYAVENLLGVQEDDIMFCAPTGKAANRLKEVVKRQTSTVNSLFGISGDSVSLNDEDDVLKKDSIRVLIVDESSMPNVNLLYEMLLYIETNTYIYFLGDKEQLPPIGFGKPFATMLTFLPTVVLNVTKRASDTSGLTYNAKKIIYESDGVIEDLEERPDFHIVNTKAQDEAVSSVLNICSYHLGLNDSVGFRPVDNVQAINPDDIQVITPINKHSWGTVELNKRLQNLFNPKKPRERYVNFIKGVGNEMEFRKGDRVIHTQSNQKDRTRLSHIADTMFTKEKTTGVMNGDVGKVLGFFTAESLDFKSDLTFSEELEKEFKSNPSAMFMAVTYKGVDEKTGDSLDFVILYRMEVINEIGNQIDVYSKDLKNVDLAYALTVHKLQGSEAKLIIMVILPVGRGGFISRNMLYTGITRGKLAGYLIGDVYGRTSCVNQGRKIEQTSKRSAVLDLL